MGTGSHSAEVLDSPFDDRIEVVVPCPNCRKAFMKRLGELRRYNKFSYHFCGLIFGNRELKSLASLFKRVDRQANHHLGQLERLLG